MQSNVDNCAGKSRDERQCKLRKTTTVVDKNLPCNITTCDATWANWGECSSSCGYGKRQRFASCKSDTICDDWIYETDTCEYIPCIVDGEWTNWSGWSNCSKLCREGIKKRTRTCMNPPPSNGGSQCLGISEETERCNFEQCQSKNFSVIVWLSQ